MISRSYFMALNSNKAPQPDCCGALCFLLIIEPFMIMFLRSFSWLRIKQQGTATIKLRCLVLNYTLKSLVKQGA